MLRVLIVDDELTARRVLHGYIEDLDCQVFEAVDAIEALETLERVKIDLALLDVRLPGYDGRWLADVVLGRFPETAVAFVTGMDALHPRTTLRKGVIGYLLKPVNRARVRALVASVGQTFD